MIEKRSRRLFQLDIGLLSKLRLKISTRHHHRLVYRYCIKYYAYNQATMALES